MKTLQSSIDKVISVTKSIMDENTFPAKLCEECIKIGCAIMLDEIYVALKDSDDESFRKLFLEVEEFKKQGAEFAKRFIN
jgi:hypothetical protein